MQGVRIQPHSNMIITNRLCLRQPLILAEWLLEEGQERWRWWEGVQMAWEREEGVTGYVVSQVAVEQLGRELLGLVSYLQAGEKTARHMR